MARISNGDNLTTALLQPGWTIQNDGYGLLSVKARWAVDKASIGTATDIGLGAQFSGISPEVLKCTVSTATYQKNDLVYVDQEYVGLASGDTSRPNITGSSGLTSEHITTHPDFFDTAIAGPPPYPASTITQSNGASLYYGNNGAHFQDPAGGKFVGFLDPDFPDFYGKTHYLAPTTSFSGHIFTTSPTVLNNMRDGIGKVSGSNVFDGVTLLPAIMGTTWVNGGKKQLLLSQVNVEQYALNASGVAYMVKISYEIRFNRDGYSEDVYAAI